MRSVEDVLRHASNEKLGRLLSKLKEMEDDSFSELKHMISKCLNPPNR